LPEADRLKHDVLFLFTDLEENGLLGAEAFVNQPSNLENVALAMNFEARGNTGLTSVFEVSPENGWLIREFKKAASYPIGNSLAYEVVRKMPNDTDLSMFRETGITYLNSSISDGYANYHSMTDTPENLDKGSLQLTGENMLSMIRYFGNHELSTTKGKDFIFFNPIGNMLILYPKSTDIIFVLISMVLFVAVVFIGLNRKIIDWKHFLIGFGLLLLTIVFALVLTYGLQKLILWVYSHYKNFYSYNFYNAPIYLLSFAGIFLISFFLVFKKAIDNLSLFSLMTGALFFHTLALIPLKIYFSGGVFFLHLPLGLASVMYLVWLFRAGSKQSLVTWVNFIAMVPALLIWVTFAYLLYIGVSLQFPYASVLILCLFAPFLLPLIVILDRIIPRLFLYLSLVVMITGLVLAHLGSEISKDQPNQTNLMYSLDLEKEQAWWISQHQIRDNWNRQYLDSFQPDSTRLGPRIFKRWMKKAEVYSFETGNIRIDSDTIRNGKRFMKLKVIPAGSTVSVDMAFPESAFIRSLDGREIELSSGDYPNPIIRYFAVPKGGISMELTLDASDPAYFYIIERQLGLPSPDMLPLPEDHIHGPGHYSNTTQIRRKVEF
jgi:hypothetical protein